MTTLAPQAQSFYPLLRFFLSNGPPDAMMALRKLPLSSFLPLCQATCTSQPSVGRICIYILVGKQPEGEISGPAPAQIVMQIPPAEGWDLHVTVTLRPVVQVSAGAKAGDAPHTRQKSDPDKAPVPYNMLELRVTDNGQGIPAEQLDRIFERFHRVDTRLTRETGGLGLGLTICKRIVELHGGAIWDENRSSRKGSAFYVRLLIDGAAALL
jgi:hypothetical protein